MEIDDREEKEVEERENDELERLEKLKRNRRKIEEYSGHLPDITILNHLGVNVRRGRS